MKSKVITAVIYVIAAVITILNTVFGMAESLFPNLDKLPKGNSVYSSISPDGKSELKVYTVSNSVGDAVRGEVSYKGKNVKNVYWETDVIFDSAEWIGNDVIRINDILLDMKSDDVYDSRRGVSLFRSGALAENTDDIQ